MAFFFFPFPFSLCFQEDSTASQGFISLLQEESRKRKLGASAGDKTEEAKELRTKVARADDLKTASRPSSPPPKRRTFAAAPMSSEQSARRQLTFSNIQNFRVKPPTQTKQPSERGTKEEPSNSLESSLLSLPSQKPLILRSRELPLLPADSSPFLAQTSAAQKSKSTAKSPPKPNRPLKLEEQVKPLKPPAVETIAKSPPKPLSSSYLMTRSFQKGKSSKSEESSSAPEITEKTSRSAASAAKSRISILSSDKPTASRNSSKTQEKRLPPWSPPLPLFFVLRPTLLFLPYQALARCVMLTLNWIETRSSWC